MHYKCILQLLLILLLLCLPAFCRVEHVIIPMDLEVKHLIIPTGLVSHTYAFRRVVCYVSVLLPLVLLGSSVFLFVAGCLVLLLLFNIV